MAKGQTVNWTGAVVYEKGEDPEITPIAEMLYSTAFDDYKSEVKVQGGEDGKAYRIRFRVTTADGSRYEAEGEFKVVEVV
jgi:hypothetical protein